MSVFDEHKSLINDENKVNKDHLIQQLQEKNYHAVFDLIFVDQDFESSAKKTYLKPEDIYPLAMEALKRKKYEEALYLVKDFQNRYPDHPDLIPNYLLVATIMDEHYQQTESAIQMLKTLYEQYQDERILSKIAEFEK